MTPSVSVAYRVRPRDGEHECGDAVISMQSGDELVLAVVDALGHGPHAAVAARSAVAALRRMRPSLPIEARIESVHEACRGTRGVAMTMLLLGADRAVAVGIGNVALRASGTKLPFVPTAGALGAIYRKPRVASAPLVGGSRFILHSDGVSSRFSLIGIEAVDAERACDRIFEDRAACHDDAALLVVDVGDLNASS
jgi:negative regulator of sigma-B (phosphoserine phosphatase)